MSVRVRVRVSVRVRVCWWECVLCFLCSSGATREKLGVVRVRFVCVLLLHTRSVLCTTCVRLGSCVFLIFTFAFFVSLPGKRQHAVVWRARFIGFFSPMRLVRKIRSGEIWGG